MISAPGTVPCDEQVLGSWLVPETGLGRGGTEPQGKGWLPKWRWQKTVNHTGFETGPWCTAQADLELLIHLLQCTERWNDTCMLLRCVACEFAILLLWPQGLGLQIHTSTSCLMTHYFVGPMHGQVILRNKISAFIFFYWRVNPGITHTGKVLYHRASSGILQKIIAFSILITC